ncbi:IPT/TIG domain-containing protein [Flavobacterium sp. JAS]|uniref:IPT/TIG domain-containing protein n=1 Tax=Flavobacterium sp. JAS TaxID=2897329 RepID=UPI001E589554|nr:IPT/TIG domain-containing protein [Flavobacterium sp. JAS]MCD0470732.1 IPT/TIG domain-containing protein [Flavobacterium sp. JAS]
MKHFFSILTLFILISCSSPNGEEAQPPNSDTQTPTIQSISTSSTNIGDTIIINGQHFDPNSTYTITFNGTSGQIAQITSTTISVKVPVGTTSGPLQLTTNGVTVNAGYISIIGQNRLFAYKQYGEIVELNSVTGVETKTLVYGPGSHYLTELKYFAPTNEIIGQGFISNNNGTNTYQLFKVKLADKTIKNIIYPGYDQLIVTTTGKLYGYKLYEGIIELNPNTGSEIGSLINTGSDQLYGLIYNPQTNEIMGDKGLLDNNGKNIHKFCKIKLSDNSVTENIYYGYDELIPATNGKLYAYRATEKIVELNPATGTEIKTLINISTPNISNLTYYPQTNQIIGKKIIYNNGIATYKLLKLNLTNNSLSENNIIKDDYDYFIVTN